MKNLILATMMVIASLLSAGPASADETVQSETMTEQEEVFALSLVQRFSEAQEEMVTLVQDLSDSIMTGRAPSHDSLLKLNTFSREVEQMCRSFLTWFNELVNSNGSTVS